MSSIWYLFVNISFTGNLQKKILYLSLKKKFDSEPNRIEKKFNQLSKFEQIYFFVTILEFYHYNWMQKIEIINVDENNKKTKKKIF